MIIRIQESDLPKSDLKWPVCLNGRSVNISQHGNESLQATTQQPESSTACQPPACCCDVAVGHGQPPLLSSTHHSRTGPPVLYSHDVCPCEVLIGPHPTESHEFVCAFEVRQPTGTGLTGQHMYPSHVFFRASHVRERCAVTIGMDVGVRSLCLLCGVRQLLEFAWVGV